MGTLALILIDFSSQRENEEDVVIFFDFHRPLPSEPKEKKQPFALDKKKVNLDMRKFMNYLENIKQQCKYRMFKF